MTKTPNTSDDPVQREKVAQAASAAAGAKDSFTMMSKL